MKSRICISGLALAVAILFFGKPALSQEKPKDPPKPVTPTTPAPTPTKDAAPKPTGDKSAAAMDPVMEAYMKAAQTGPFHANLKPLAGSWNCEVKMFMAPGEPTVTKGTSERKWILDGRFLQETHNGTFMDKPFTGMGISGYDNITKKYVHSWIDSMGTGIMLSTGTADSSGKTFTYTSENPNPLTGQMEKMRMVTKILGDDKHTFEMYGPGPDGKEMKHMEIAYTKK